MIAQRELNMQFGHQSAVKSTITVFPSERACCRASGENGSQGMIGCQNKNVKANRPNRIATAKPPNQAVAFDSIEATAGVRPIHQQANQRPNSSVIVGR